MRNEYTNAKKTLGKTMIRGKQTVLGISESLSRSVLTEAAGHGEVRAGPWSRVPEGGAWGSTQRWGNTEQLGENRQRLGT